METERILLRPWRENDAEALFKYASDPEVGPRAGWPPHKNVEESLEIIRTVFNNSTTWAIELKETGEAIGAIGYGPSCDCNLPAREGEPITGYWVAKPYWNQGICTEALGLMIDYICRTTNIASLISGHFIDNPASGRVMEKCGFVATGETCIDVNQYQGKDRPIRVLRLELPDRASRAADLAE
jgi:RimJ/RimL family protein N-acetyltransferase